MRISSIAGLEAKRVSALSLALSLFALSLTFFRLETFFSLFLDSPLAAQHSRAMPRFSVGLDVGTQGAKAVVFDLDSKKVVSRGERESV